MNKSIEIFNSTLRDRAQGQGVSFSLEGKVKIVRALDAENTTGTKVRVLIELTDGRDTWSTVGYREM